MRRFLTIACLLPLLAMGMAYEGVTIQGGSWVDKAGNEHFFDLSGVELRYDFEMPEPPGEHVCEFLDGDCTCIYAGSDVTEADIPEEYRPPEIADFVQPENWLDEGQVQVNRRGNYVLPWTGADGSSGTVTLDDLASTAAWRDMVMAAYQELAAELSEYASQWLAQYKCDKDNPQHQEIVVVAGTQANGCVKCNRCGAWLGHYKPANSCTCLCGQEVDHTRNPATCRCYCGQEHFPVLSGCPGVCAVCLEAVDGVLSDPNKHAARTDGQCGCKCGYYNSSNPADNEEFHQHSSGDESCMCVCARYHFWTEGECENVCGTCKHRKCTRTPTEATDEDHTPNAASAHRCGCRCGRLTANGTDNPRFHIQMEGSCRCYGSEGTGGRFHFPCARADCTHICQYQENGVSHLANEGTVAVKVTELTIATPADHTPDTGATHCGCKCQEYNNDSSAADLAGMHNHKDGTCACWCTKYAASVDDDDLWHHWTDGACLCDCTLKHHFAGGNACAGICAACKMRDNSSDVASQCIASDGDHTAKPSGCGCACGHVTAAGTTDPTFHNGHGNPQCRCSCGKLHKYYNGSTARCRVCSVCQLTEDDREPSDETLHKADPSKNCECYCGYFGPNNHTSTSEALHTWDAEDEDSNGTPNCMCKCGTLHKFREGSTYLSNQDLVCENVCAYCKERKRDGSAAAEADHDPKPVSAARCGCKCGKLDSTATLNKFHIQKPGTCMCFGADGNGGTHHFRCPRSDCTHICQYAVNGVQHLAAGVDHEIGYQAANPSDHTKTTTAGQCGCKCRTYTGDEVDCPAAFHVQNPNYCGCYCGNSSVDGHHRGPSNSCWCYCDSTIWRGYHVYPSGECRCYCTGTAHDADKEHRRIQREDGKCPGVCHGPCGEAANAAYKLNHSPKADGCGCDCGQFAGSQYVSSLFHNGHGNPYCLCTCGAFHKYSASRTDCNGICQYCGDGKTNYAFVDPITIAPADAHTFPARQCECSCGKHKKHKFADDACTCYCGDETRAHQWRLTSQMDIDSWTCPTCGKTITQTEYVYTCARCDAMQSTYGESGHATGCGENDSGGGGEDPAPCGCGCTDCSCAACTSGTGICTTCGRPCGDGSTSGGSGSGGSTPGPSSSLDDI